jgi:hypothetical protein
VCAHHGIPICLQYHDNQVRKQLTNMSETRE